MRGEPKGFVPTHVVRLLAQSLAFWVSFLGGGDLP